MLTARGWFVLACVTALWLAAGVASHAQQGITPCAAASLSVTNTSSNTQLSACAGTTIVWNIGTVEAFYTYGTASNTAATTSNWSVPAGGFVVLNLGTSRQYLAAITASSTTTIRITQGQTR